LKPFQLQWFSMRQCGYLVHLDTNDVSMWSLYSCAAGGEMAAETDPSGNFSWHLWVQFFANMVFGFWAKWTCPTAMSLRSDWMIKWVCLNQCAVDRDDRDDQHWIKHGKEMTRVLSGSQTWQWKIHENSPFTDDFRIKTSMSRVWLSEGHFFSLVMIDGGALWVPQEIGCGSLQAVAGGQKCLGGSARVKG